MQTSKFIKNKELFSWEFYVTNFKESLYHKVHTSTLTISVQQQ